MLLLLLVHALNNDLFIDAADAVNDYFNAVAVDPDHDDNPYTDDDDDYEPSSAAEATSDPPGLVTPTSLP